LLAVYATCKQILNNQRIYGSGYLTIDQNVNIDGITVVVLTLSLFSAETRIHIYADSLISAYRLHIQPPRTILLFLSCCFNQFYQF
jgi:hypothetical protein